MPAPDIHTLETMPRVARWAIGRHVTHARLLALRMVDPYSTLDERQAARIERAAVMARAQAIAQEHAH